MSNSKMLIDAAHPEETRVVVLKGNRVEEFDFESASKKQLRGNIYLAKVTRVEPSLQAAFVEYGGNRHGFLAFSEIHPDYYQIPMADRQALLDEEARANRDEDDEPRESRGGEGRGGEGRGDRGGRRGGEARGDGQRGEGRGNGGQRGEARSDKEAAGGEGRTDRGSRGEGRGDRDGRGSRDNRGERGDRGQRRSRRHRRDNAPATALDRRGPIDESISEPAFPDSSASPFAEAEHGLTAGGAPAEVETTLAAEASSDGAMTAGEMTAGEMTAGGEAAEGFSAGEAEVDDAAPPRDGDEVQAPAGPADTAVVHAEGAVPDAAETVVAVAVAAEIHVSVETVGAEGGQGADIRSEISHGDVSHGEVGRAEAIDAEAFQAEAARTEPAEADVVAAAGDSHVLQGHADDATHADDASGTAPSDGPSPDIASHRDEAAEPSAEARTAPSGREPGGEPDAGDHAADHEEEHVEQIGGDALSDVAPRPVRLRRHYKIQEVIKRRQILLIQVVKEERGNKGAALTTYLSLAGRYSVLMPNTAKGGGISRKITDGEDRKRLKAIAGELDVPEGMGVILRTAGASRTPVEVRRDFEYLLRMWESVRELTLKSSAPTLVYEEGSLIKRSIRDLYSQDIGEIVVSGDAGYAEARDFMRMLMPGNAKNVVEYSDPSPIFAKSGVEAQLDAMFSAHVTLKSGGYLVINQTEALVAIDVNSGRSTREHNIEDTALRTNMEAADEVARQLRLRDLAGLIVVDFIDMEEGRNNRAVERRIKEALKNDRARIQIGRISHFGLLEMSRQRIRTGVLEGSTVVCPHCAGAGTVRSTSSVALHVLRLVEDALIKDAAYDLVVRSRGEVALYMLNQKRAKLVELEQRFGVTITVEGDASLTGMVYHAIERGELATPAEAPMPRQDRVRVDSIAPIFEPEVDEVEAADAVADMAGEDGEAEGADEAIDAAGTEAGTEAGEGGERRRKRRRRRRGRDRDGASQPSDDSSDAASELGGVSDEAPLPVIGFSAEPSGADEVGSDAVEAAVSVAAEPVGEGAAASEIGSDTVAAAPALESHEAPSATMAAEPAAEALVEEAPKRRRSRRTAVRADEDAAPSATDAAVEPAVEPAGEEAPKRRRRPSRARAVEAEPAEAAAAASVEPHASVEAAAAPAGDPEPVGARPSADRDVGADTVEHHAPDAGEPAAPVETAAAETAVSETAVAEPQPDRPKRSGWWQRAKTSFGS